MSSKNLFNKSSPRQDSFRKNEHIVRLVLELENSNDNPSLRAQGTRRLSNDSSDGSFQMVEERNRNPHVRVLDE